MKYRQIIIRIDQNIDAPWENWWYVNSYFHLITWKIKILHCCCSYGGPNPPLYKTFAPRFYKTFAPRFYNFLHDFTISSTILQFPPRFYNFLHDFTIFSTILQFPPRYYNFLHDFTISSTILQFSPRYYNFLHDITISSTILQFPPRFYNFLHDFTISSTILQNICSTILQNICSTILQFAPRFYNFLHDFTIFSTILQFSPRFYKFLQFGLKMEFPLLAVLFIVQYLYHISDFCENQVVYSIILSIQYHLNITTSFQLVTEHRDAQNIATLIGNSMF